MDHLFAAADDDHDNRLSYEEILEHHDTFVGSEATDYGDHLQDIQRFQDELWIFIVQLIIVGYKYFSVTLMPMLRLLHAPISKLLPLLL